MAHVRGQIRSRVVTKVTGLVTTGSKVYSSRVFPMSSAKMPGLCVYCKGEKSVQDEGRIMIRDQEVIVDAYVEGTGFEADCDKIASEVETALYGDYNATTDKYLNGLALDLEYQASDVQYFGDAAKPYGILRMVWVARYATAAGAPETAL